MVMSSNDKIEKGLEELMLNLMMDIEPIDPPVGLRGKIISTTEKKPNRAKSHAPSGNIEALNPKRLFIFSL